MAQLTPQSPQRPKVIQVLHRMGVGGAEVLVDRMVRAMSEQFSFTVVCLDEIGTLGEGLLKDGYEVVYLPRQPGVDWRFTRRLRELVRQNEANIIHAHQFTPYFYSIACRGIWGRIPVVFTEHGRHHPDCRNWKRVAFNRVALRRRDRIVGVGHAVKRALVDIEGFAGKRVDVIHNGVPLAPILDAPVEREHVRSEFGLPPDAIIAIQVARLDYLKDHKTAARAFAQACEKVPGLAWLVVGGGPEKLAIEQEIESLGRSDQVRLIGERTDVPRLLKASDVMLLSSISEGIPLTLIEGMLAELPVITTAAGGAGEIVIDPKTGYIVDIEDSTTMSNRLVQLCHDRELRHQMGQAGQDRAIRLFDEALMHDQYSRLYTELAAIS